ncbi:hypothetical protein F5148DRAFT_1247904 [Russula earlei]|uniref:Uncharacterized protein n=1 Tax=Russula earlei TaxID=71964 RepID=A0ACC0TWJ7_9AGAM|nr:hypothetical protein F5148DRAFT_1247904 [Russula earlei]
MKKSGSGARAPSPTPTSFSGISSYRTDSYKPLRDKSSSISSPPLDSYHVARTHYEELSKYLASYLAKEPANSRSTARQKLTRLTRQQFQELSTDVYDELIRRKTNSDNNQVPFLPVRDEFHPKRNQARQKLATLPPSRFRDLSSDVYYELLRRYPEFKEEPSDLYMTSPGSTYDDFPSPDFPRDRDREPPRPRRSQDDYNPPIVGRRGDDPYGEAGPNEPLSDRDPYAPSRRKPSQDTTPRSQQLDQGRRPSVASGSDSTGTTNAQSATVTSGIIIPNKSTIAEEDIEVPYGRSESAPEDGDGETDEVEGGLGALVRRLGQDPDTDGGARSDDYFDKISFGRASVASDRSARGVGGRASAAPNEDGEKMRREYEFRIATMQSRIVNLERGLEDGDLRARQLEQSDQRVKQLEDELENFRRRAEEQSAAILALQKELDNVREDAQRSREREARRAQQDEEELQILRERCERLEEERASAADSEVVEQLRSDMEGLIAEVSDLSRRNDELMTSKDSDLVVIRDLDAQLKEYKRKYEQAKTELRSVKATSALFLQKPKFDDQLPVSADGVIPDVHITAFLTAIDSLLSAGRSNAPTRVLTPMKSVVNAVTTILDDVRSHSRQHSSPERVHALEERVEATLANLAVAAKTHATSSGLSPVSLLDAAASHLSAAVTELGRVVLLRRATKAEQEQFAPSSAGTATNGFTPGLRTVEEVRTSVGHQRGPSDGSSRRGEGERDTARDERESSSDDSSAVPTIFDQTTANTAGITSPDSAAAEGTEDAWTELRPYLEAQTESIIYAIQSVLSGLRSPTPSPTLDENLTQIITIVSSIVAVCHDNLPASHARRGGDILRELSEHANKLSEVQTLPEVTKESRQVMAKSSFAIANAMKALQKL